MDRLISDCKRLTEQRQRISNLSRAHNEAAAAGDEGTRRQYQQQLAQERADYNQNLSQFRGYQSNVVRWFGVALVIGALAVLFGSC